MAIKLCSGSSCGAAVDFFKNSTSGRTVIVDAKPIKVWMPDDLGNVTLMTGYMDHHASCPDAASFRKKKEAPSFLGSEAPE